LEDLDTYDFNEYGLPARSRYTDTHTTYSHSRDGGPTTTHHYHYSTPVVTTYTPHSYTSISDLPPSPHYTKTKAETWHGRAIPNVAHKRLTVTQPPPRSVHTAYTDITETDRVMKRVYPTGHTDSYCNMRYADPDSNLRDYVGSDGEIQSRYYVSDGYKYRDHYPTIERRWMSDMKRGDTQVNHKYIVVPSVRDVYNDVYHKSMYTKAHEGANLGPAHLACVSFSGAGKVIPRRRKYYDDDKVKNDVALLSGYGETVGAVKEHRMNQVFPRAPFAPSEAVKKAELREKEQAAREMAKIRKQEEEERELAKAEGRPYRPIVKIDAPKEEIASPQEEEGETKEERKARRKREKEEARLLAEMEGDVGVEEVEIVEETKEEKKARKKREKAEREAAELEAEILAELDSPTGGEAGEVGEETKEEKKARKKREKAEREAKELEAEILAELDGEGGEEVAEETKEEKKARKKREKAEREAKELEAMVLAELENPTDEPAAEE